VTPQVELTLKFSQNLGYNAQISGNATPGFAVHGDTNLDKLPCFLHFL